MQIRRRTLISLLCACGAAFGWTFECCASVPPRETPWIDILPGDSGSDDDAAMEIPSEERERPTPVNREEPGVPVDDRANEPVGTGDDSPSDAASTDESEEALGEARGLFALGGEEEQGTSTEDRGLLAVLPGLDGGLVQTVAALAIVIGLMLALRAVLKRSSVFRRVGRPAGLIDVLARYPIGRKQHLVVYRFARRILFVHQTGQDVTVLSEVTEPSEVALVLSRLEGKATKAKGRFSDHLENEGAAYGSSGDRATRAVTKRGYRLANARIETIDLTRSRAGRFGMGRRGTGA